MRVDELGPDILGVLVCVVIRGKSLPRPPSIPLAPRNLPDKTVIGKQSPYATVTFGSHKKRTKTIPRGGQQPTWDEEFRFEIPKDINAVTPGSSLSTNKHGGVGSVSSGGESVVGKGPGGKAKFEIRENAVILPQHKGKRLLRLAVYADDAKDPHLIGDALLELEDTIKKGSFDDWVPLELKNRSAGEIYLELTWYHNGPRPKSRAPRPASSSAASTYGGAGLRVSEPDPALHLHEQPEPVDDWDRDGAGSSIGAGGGGGMPLRPLSQTNFHAYTGPPLELGPDYPDPDVGPLASSLAGLSVRPSLPQPPTQHHSHLAHSTSYYDTHASPASPASATGYPRPLPDPRFAGGSSVNGGVGYDLSRSRQQGWRHSSPYPNQQGPPPGQHGIGNGYPAGPPPSEYGHPPVSEFGATPYVPAEAQYYHPADAQWQGGHHPSYSDVGHQADYGPPPPPAMSEFDHPANQHRYSTGSPLPPPGAYGPPPPGTGYHPPPPAPPSLPQPPQPPIPPPTPLEYERQVYGGGGGGGGGGGLTGQGLGRSQSVASSISQGYPHYGQVPLAHQFAQSQYAPSPVQPTYHAPPPPTQSPYNPPPPPPPQHAYSPAPHQLPHTQPYNPYAVNPSPTTAPPPAAGGYGAGGYAASDYGPPPGVGGYTNGGVGGSGGGGYREPSPGLPPPPLGPGGGTGSQPGNGNYLRQQYDLNLAQQGLGQSQGGAGVGTPQVYNAHGY